MASIARCPYVVKGLKDGPPLLFMSGFPDSEVSAWGSTIPEKFERHYRCIFMCLPGYSTTDKAALEKPWGFEKEEVLQMMNNTVEAVGLADQPFNMIAHDWGAYYALLYSTRHPRALSRLILCDIGMCTAFTLPFAVVPFVAFYQIFFAVCYWLSQTISLALAEWLFLAIGMRAFFAFLSPPLLRRKEIPAQSLTVRKCYPYYYLWRRLLTGRMLPEAFPACPVLFLYGTKKWVSYHDQRFLARIDATPGCSRCALPAGHWFTVDEPAATVQLMAAFLEEGRR